MSVPEVIGGGIGAGAIPPCPHFGPCGGCQLQDLAYASQLEQKGTRMRALLEATGLALPEIELHPSPPLGYRNRVRFTLGEVDGQLRAGYLSAPQPNQKPAFLPIAQCPIAAPLLWRGTQSLIELVNQRASVWLRRAPFQFDQLELFTSADESQLQISVIVRTSARHLPAKFTAELASLCESLRNQVPELAGAGMLLLPPRSTRSRRIEQPRSGPQWGRPGLNYQMESGLIYWVPRGAFFQVNRFLLPKLVDLVAGGRTGQLAWDLYAGVGLFTTALAPRFARITAVEIAEPAFTALAGRRLPNRHSVKDTALDFLRSAVLQRDRPDLIVLDPPRTGAGPEVCGLLGRIAAPALVYVSCSPETLPSDLTTLADAGYLVAELHLLDLFPQTDHIETVAILAHAGR
jgi:23S rRNA (uracil1939-C5)-methyltransferase